MATVTRGGFALWFALMFLHCAFITYVYFIKTWLHLSLIPQHQLHSCLFTLPCPINHFISISVVEDVAPLQQWASLLS